jgi:hypothetical protein
LLAFLAKYLKKVLAAFTNLAANIAQKNEVAFKEDYRIIGYFSSSLNR